MDASFTLISSIMAVYLLILLRQAVGKFVLLKERSGLYYFL